MTLLEINDLHQSYNGGVPVLRGISLKLEQGEFVGVIGLSGAGKSSLLRCVNRLVEASAGEIRVPKELLNHGAAGAPVDVLKLDRAGLRQLRRRIGMLVDHLSSRLRSLVV